MKGRSRILRAAACALLLLMVSAAGATGTGPDAPATLSRLFADAATEQREGRLDAAANLYRAILARGYLSPELFYNLGHCHLAAGKTGPAMLNLRRAFYLSPRDPDIRTAMVTASRGRAAPSTLAAWLELCSVGEWTAVALCAYWAIIAAAVALLMRRKSRLARLALVFCGAVLLLSAVALAHWRRAYGPDHAVVLLDTEAFGGPSSTSRATFELQAGEAVRVAERWESWARVSDGVRNGWVPRSSVERIWPP